MSAETQETVCAWIDGTFPGTDPESPRRSIRALEEMVELCLASGASTRTIMHSVAKALADNGATESLLGGVMEATMADPGKIPSEAADVQIALYGIAGMRGFDLAAEVDRKMAVNRTKEGEMTANSVK